MNKKGILTSEVLKIILAVIGISMLLYLSVSLYSTFTTSSKFQHAQSSMELIDSHIKVILEDEQISEQDVLIESPNAWGIYAFPYKFELTTPKQCNGENCVCICPNTDGWIFSENLKSIVSSCDESGFCVNYNSKVKTILQTGGSKENTPIRINHPFSLKIQQTSEGIELISVSK